MLERFHLVVIREVERQGSLTAAANALHLTQSALSHAVRKPEQLNDEVLITYPVETDRLDIYNQFLTPAGVVPRRHKSIETTDIMLQMVASGRGVAALPRWLADEYADRMPVVPVKLGRKGIAKQIFLGIRDADASIDYLAAFVALARESTWSAPRMLR